MYVSVLFVRILLSELRRRNWSDSACLEDSGIDANTFSNVRAMITAEEWSRLLLRAIDLTGDPALGLALGARISPSMLQVVGMLSVACRTLREAIATFQHYDKLLSTITTWELEEQGDQARFFCSDVIEHRVARRTSIDATLALSYNIGRDLVAVASDEIWCQHDEPPYAAQYARVFTCPVRFGQPRNGLIFARRLLDQPLPHGDPTLREVLRTSAETLLRERASESTVERVRALLRYEQDVGRMNERYVADQMKMKVRALRRRLGAEHTPLTNLFAEARTRLAQRELSKPGASIKQVAHNLGFSDASAFHRSFKRVTGVTPAQFMKEVGASPVRSERRSMANGSSRGE